MNLYTILLLLAIPGLVPSCCEGHSGDEVSGEGSWEEEDWSGSTDSSTGEDDSFTEFDSGSSSANETHDDEGPRIYPRISRTYSNKSFVTSGVGEDKGGSHDDDGSHSKSHGSRDQGSANDDFGSNMDLAKIGDAIDAMKKLKKAKSDQEFAKKLRSGPESLGVAFKTFEQLSGLWISVMHRIWRVWKAKGAKVVMHSIVQDLMNSTGRAIKRKVGHMLNKQTVVDSNGSGSATFKDEGSTEPEQSHHTVIIHKQRESNVTIVVPISSNTSSKHNERSKDASSNVNLTHRFPTHDLPVERVSIDFIKNKSKEVRTSTSKKTVKQPVKKVKVSVFSRNANDSKPIQKSVIQSQPKRVPEKSNDTLVVQETSTNKQKMNITSKSEKSSTTVASSSMVLPNVKTATTLVKDSEHAPRTNYSLESTDNTKAPSVSVGDDGKGLEENVSHIDTEKTQNVTQHVGENDAEHKQRNVTEKSMLVKTENSSVRNIDTKSQGEVTQLQETSKQNSSIIIKGQRNENTSTSSKSVSLGNVTISRRQNKAINKTGKTRVLETLKINFLKKNRTSHNNKSSVSQVNALETRRNAELLVQQNESNSKTDSEGEVTASSKSTPTGGSDIKGTGVLNKNISYLNKSDGITNSANSQPRDQKDNELSSNKRIDENTRTPATTSAKSEKIVVNLNRRQDTSKENKTNISVNDTDTVKGMNGQEVNEDAHKNSQKEKTSVSTLATKMQTRTVLNVNSAQLKSKNMDDHNKEQKMNTSFTNVRSKEDGSKISLTSTNVQSAQKHLESLKHDPVQTSITKIATLDSSKENETIAKVNVQITKSNTSPSERDSKSLQNGGTKDGKLPHVGSELTHKALNENLTQSVDKMKDKVEAKQTDRGSDNSRKSADDLSKKNAQENMDILTRNKSHKRIEETSQKMERLNHSLQATSKVEEERTKQRHKDQQKDQANTESRALQDKNNTEIKQTNPKSIKPRDNVTSSLIHNSTSVTLANKKDSEKVTQHPHEKSIKVNKEDHRISPVKSMESHKEKSENPKIAKKTGKNRVIKSPENSATRGRETVTHGPESGVTNDPGSGVTHDPVAHETGSSVTHDPGSDVTNDPGSGVTHDPESNVTKEPGVGVTHDPESDVTHEPGSGVTHAPGSGATHSPENLSIDPVTTNHHSKRVSRHETLKDPHSPDKKSSKQKLASTRSTKKPSQPDLDNVKSLSTPHTNDAKNVHVKKRMTPANSKHVTQASRRPQSTAASQRHHIASQEISKSDDKTEPTKMQSDSSRTDPNPATKEEIKPSKTEQVEVMTSRTPPTSLLTTSNDDNTYSIKQIVQGPKGSSYVYGSHGDEKVHSLEKKVFKLENEVTVLETAMANLAKRLLVVEQKSEIPKPTLATNLLPSMVTEPSKLTEPHEQHPVHSQQQTTVFVSKDLGTTPQNPLPQYGPERIVIPISSLYSGGAGRVSTHSAAIHEVVDSQEAKVDSHPDEEGQEKSQDSTHVTLRDGALSSPISEAHAVVRPIVNIIVPNSRADLLSGGALCIPRCQNGGRCLDRNTCRCPTFFTGDHCERFSLRDLLESPNPRVRPYRKLQRVVVSEPPDRQLLDGTLNLDSASPALEYRDLNQDLEPGKEFVAKQQPVEIASPSNNAEVDGATRRRQLILEI